MGAQNKTFKAVERSFPPPPWGLADTMAPKTSPGNPTVKDTTSVNLIGARTHHDNHGEIPMRMPIVRPMENRIFTPLDKK